MSELALVSSGSTTTSNSYLEQITVLLESVVRQGSQQKKQQQQEESSNNNAIITTDDANDNDNYQLDRVLELTSGFVDHQDVASHNHVAASGAIHVLARFLVQHYYDGRLSLHQAVTVCTILSRLLQCDDEYALPVMEQVACELICCLLWIVVDQQNYEQRQHDQKQQAAALVVVRRPHKHDSSNNNSNTSQGQPPDDDIQKAAAAGHWASAILIRISHMELALTHVHDAPKLVRFLQQILRDDQDGDKLLARTAMRLLDGLARHEESKVWLMNMPSLVHDAVQANTIHDREDATRSACLTVDYHLIRFLRKITWDTHNKLKATKTKGFITFLLQCAKHAHLQIRKEALGVFWMLSFDAASVQALVDYPVKDAAVQALAVAAGVPELRTLALQALHRIIRRNGTGPPKRTKKLLLANDSLTRGGGMMDLESSPASEVHKARLIESLCRFTSVNETCHPTLIEALASMSQSASDAIRFWAAKSFHGQSLNKMNQFFLARTPSVLTHVVQLAQDPVARVRERAISVLLQLTSERSNAKVLGLNYHLLEALLTNARNSNPDDVHHRRHIGYTYDDGFHYDDDDHTHVSTCKEEEPPSVSSDRAARLSIQGILSLASQEVAKERIAKHHDCLSTLATFGVSDNGDVELKQAALHGVIMLVHLL